MTVSSSSRVQTFAGSGTTGPFTFNFRILSVADITVTKVNNTTGVRTALTTPADYSCSLVSLGLSGGSITTVAAVASGETLVVEGNTPVTQPVKYSNQGEFFPETHEVSYDRITLIAQELNGKQTRSLQMKPETALVSAPLVDEPVAGAYLLWNTLGTGITNSSALARITEVEKSADYTLALSDENKLVSLTGSTGRTFTIPPNSSVAFPIGSQLFFCQKGTGTLTLAQGSGVTILSEFSWKKLNTQYSFASVIKIATNTWVLAGSLKA